jgi:transposase-like protein
MAKGTARDSGKARAWRRKIEQQAGSGLSVRAWCHQHGVTESAFYRWRRELSRRDVEAQASSFVPVHVTADRPERSDPQMEIVLTDGRCVRVHGSVDRQMLADVLGVLTSVDTVDPERRAC